VPIVCKKGANEAQPEPTKRNRATPLPLPQKRMLTEELEATWKDDIIIRPTEDKCNARETLSEI
jgi:hypothetical protein